MFSGVDDKSPEKGMLFGPEKRGSRRKQKKHRFGKKKTVFEKEMSRVFGATKVGG